jgi:hypothetical protein
MHKRLKGSLLDDILSQKMIAQIPVGDGIGHLLETLDQDLIGFAVAGLCNLDQLR